MKKLTPEKINTMTDILKIQFDHAKTRFEIQFQTFTWWASLFLAGIGALLLQGESIRNLNLPSWVFILVTIILFVIPIIPGTYIIRQSKYYWGNMQIVDKIEASLGLFDKNIYLEGESILPEAWKKHLTITKPRIRDNWFAWFYVVVLYILGSILGLLVLFVGV